MIQVSIIGSGNVAHHIIKAFSDESEIKLVQVFSRKPQAVAGILSPDKIISDFNQLVSVDVIIDGV